MLKIPEGKRLDMELDCIKELVRKGFVKETNGDATWHLTEKGEMMLLSLLGDHFDSMIPISILVRQAAAKYVERHTSPGERAYRAYQVPVKGKSFDGKPLLPFHELSDAIRAGWEDAAKAGYSAFRARGGL